MLGSLSFCLFWAFAAFGVPEISNLTQNHALKVGKQGFGTREITEEFNRAMVNRRAESEGSFTREDAIATGLPEQIIDSMATRSAIAQEADRMGLVMPRSIVSDFLQSSEQYQNPRTGKFDQETLGAILQNYNLSPRQFEALLQRDLLQSQLVGSLSASAPAPESLIDSLVLRESERRTVEYIEITEEMAGVAKEPTPDDLNSYYEQNQAQFTAPEYRTFNYVALNRDDFAKDIEVPEEDLRKLYEAGKERLYSKPERRTLYQIPYDSEAQAEAAAEALRQGAPIEQVAEDRGFALAAITNTEIGKDDIIDPNVAEAAFSEGSQEGDVIGPVKGLFGSVVIQIAGITAPETQSFEGCARRASDPIRGGRRAPQTLRCGRRH